MSGLVPGHKVEIEIRDTSSLVVGGVIRFEIGIVDYDCMCRLDFEEYQITGRQVRTDEALVAALAHYQATLLEHGVVGGWVDENRKAAALPGQPIPLCRTQTTPSGPSRSHSCSLRAGAMPR